MKKLLAFLLVLVMITGVIAGCGSEKPPATGNTPSPSPENAQTGNPLDAPGSLSFLVIQQAGAPLSESMPVMKELSTRTNTKLTFTNVPKADMATKVQTLVAANQLPDVVEYETENQGTDLVNYLESGTFIYLNDYLTKEKTPNITALFEKYPSYKKDMTTDDGKIPGLAQLTERQWRCDWVINNTFLTELNMAAPTNLDELYNYLVAVKKKYPDATPMGVGPWAGDRNAIVRPIMYAFNVTNEWWLYNDDSYLFGPYEKQEEYKAALKYINKLYTEGLIDPEFFSISAEATNAKISNNKVGILYGWADGYGQWGKNGTWGIDMIPCTPIKGPDGNAYMRGNPRMAVQPHYLTKNCKDINRAVAFFDYCYSEEATDLLNWGIEGTHYMTINGERQYTDSIMKHDQGYVIGRYAQGLAHPRFPMIINAQAELIVNGPETAKHVEYMKQGTIMPGIPQLYSTTEEEEKYKEIYADISNLYKLYEGKLITSKGDFDTIFAEYMAMLEAEQVKEMIEIKHAQYERYKAR